MNTTQPERQKMLTASYETYVSFYERVWAEAAVKNPMQKPLFDLILSVLGELRTLLPKMAAEADSFIQMIEVTEFDEALDRLDRELAHRERNLAKLLIGVLNDNRRIVRLEHARGRVADVESALSNQKILRLLSLIDRIAETKGFLTHAPEVSRLHHNSSIISDAYARSIGESFKPIRQKLPHNLLRFSSRYVIDFVRRNRIRVFVSVILVLVIEFIIHAGELLPWGLGGLLAVGGLVATWLFERICKPQWTRLHRSLVQNAALALYDSFARLSADLAYTDVVHELAFDETKRQELAAQLRRLDG
jgi:hypothetical protein